MTRSRKVLLVALLTLAPVALGLQACTAGTELNPQPLPPATPEGTGDNSPSDGTSSGGGGTGATPPAASADAAAPDGSDAGDAADGAEQGDQ